MNSYVGHPIIRIVDNSTDFKGQSQLCFFTTVRGLTDSYWQARLHVSRTRCVRLLVPLDQLITYVESARQTLLINLLLHLSDESSSWKISTWVRDADNN